ncbi:Oleosin [Quillaja saponaria]|uniref:Oleosin n=1 Tax=Quillaja saponaria TaxID=32244 RepID=A0AAD7PPW0_QUISA|nr:Oleosin [Quillaja saponaria]
MADYQQGYGDETGRCSGMTVLCASLAGIAIGGPLLGMIGFSLLASATLLLVSSPLLLLFSPLLLGAASVLVGAMAGFAMAVALGLAGVSTFGWIVREVRGTRFGGGLERLGDESVQILKGKTEQDWADYSTQGIRVSRG